MGQNINTRWIWVKSTKVFFVIIFANFKLEIISK